MNALNANKGLDEVAHKSVSELVKMETVEKKTLQCQACIPSYPCVP